jgi:hypothetical protein
MTAKADIIRKRGDTYDIVVIVKSNKKAVDISGWTDFKLTIDPSSGPDDDTGNVEQLTGALVTTGTDGKVAFVPTGTIPAGDYFYDVQGLNPQGRKITVIEGKYKLTQDIGKD